MRATAVGVVGSAALDALDGCNFNLANKMSKWHKAQGGQAEAAGRAKGAGGRWRRQTKQRPAHCIAETFSPNTRPSAAAAAVAATENAANGNEQCGNVAAGCGRATATTMGRMRNL